MAVSGDEILFTHSSSLILGQNSRLLYKYVDQWFFTCFFIKESCNTIFTLDYNTLLSKTQPPFVKTRNLKKCFIAILTLLLPTAFTIFLWGNIILHNSKGQLYIYIYIYIYEVIYFVQYFGIFVEAIAFLAIQYTI
jgi:hypothetical protein